MCCLTASVCILCASALAGAKAQLKKLLKIIGCCGGICICAICARSATILQAERKSNNIAVNSHTKNTLPRKLKKHQKVPLGESKCLPKSAPEAGESPQTASRARLPPNNFYVLGSCPQRMSQDAPKTTRREFLASVSKSLEK